MHNTRLIANEIYSIRYGYIAYKMKYNYKINICSNIMCELQI